MLGQASAKLSKMHARRNPNLSIQSTAAYSQLSPPPQSATSGAFLSPTVASRRGLLAGRTPPASPSLPSLIPRHGKKPTQQNHSRLVKRILISCCGIAIVIWLVLRQLYTESQQTVTYGDEAEEWEMVGGTQLPKEPMAVAVQDTKGKMRWTVSIPSNLEFPLRAAQYSDICQQAMELSTSVRQEAQGASNIAKRMLGYNQEDKFYIDPQDAEQQALLPPAKDKGRPRSFVEDEAIADGFSTAGQRVCERSLTYVMDTDEAGFGNTLMRLWMAYGLAKAENRTFFIDDSRW